MVESALDIALGLLALGFLVAFIRLVRGPSLVDRLLAVETSMLLVLGIVVVVSVKNSQEFFVAGLLIAVVGIVSSVAVAKYLVNGRPF